MSPKYKRVLIKLSGEAMAGDQHFGINWEMVKKTALQLKEVADAGVQLAVVVGGGNFWRGRSSEEMNRTTADYIGMMGTVMNALSLQEGLEAAGVPSVVQTAIEMRQLAEVYNRRNAMAHLESGRILIFGAGTGSPFFSTDTTAALRAAEIEAEVILMAKSIDAVYSADPETDPYAIKFSELTHDQVLEKNLKVIDGTAAALCRDNKIAIHIFGLAEEDGMMKAIRGEPIGTIVK
ncbi:MAG: UMP kinase [Eubacteriales bacterium]|nr:UMP kinase [Eubacteriales bacterium]